MSESAVSEQLEKKEIEPVQPDLTQTILQLQSEVSSLRNRIEIMQKKRERTAEYRKKKSEQMKAYHQRKKELEKQVDKMNQPPPPLPIQSNSTPSLLSNSLNMAGPPSANILQRPQAWHLV